MKSNTKPIEMEKYTALDLYVIINDRIKYLYYLQEKYKFNEKREIEGLKKIKKEITKIFGWGKK